MNEELTTLKPLEDAESFDREMQSPRDRRASGACSKAEKSYRIGVPDQRLPESVGQCLNA
jgi:hypothetical protein